MRELRRLAEATTEDSAAAVSHAKKTNHCLTPATPEADKLPLVARGTECGKESERQLCRHSILTDLREMSCRFFRFSNFGHSDIVSILHATPKPAAKAG